MHEQLSRLKVLLPLWVVLAIAVMSFLYGTAPDTLGPLGITVFFIVAYLFLVVTIQLVVASARRVFTHPAKRSPWRLTYSLIGAFLPITAVGLDSLDQLVLRDILIFFGLALLLIFYASRRGVDDRTK